MKILKKDNSFSYNTLPIIPLREMVIFPNVIKTFYVGRKESITGIEKAIENFDSKVFLVTQKSSNINNPGITQAIPSTSPIPRLINLFLVQICDELRINNLPIFGVSKSIFKTTIPEDIIKIKATVINNPYERPNTINQPTAKVMTSPMRVAKENSNPKK